VIVHSNARGQLTVRGADGNVLGRYNPAIYLASFSMTAWGEDPISNKLVASDKDFIYVLATDWENPCPPSRSGECNPGAA
jgi:hypothetical protein